RREGAEVEARWADERGWSVYAGYAFTRATFRTDGLELFSIREAAGRENEVEPGDALPLVPTHAARAGVRAALRRELALGLDARYVGERWLRGDEANEEDPLDDHLLFDAEIRYRGRAVELVARVENLLDTRYASFGTFNLNQGAGGRLERFLTPGAPRTLRVALRRTIGGTDAAR